MAAISLQNSDISIALIHAQTSSIPVFITLKPEDAHPASKGTYDEINKGHSAKPEEILKERYEEDQDEATYRSSKYPPHRFVGGA